MAIKGKSKINVILSLRRASSCSGSVLYGDNARGETYSWEGTSTAEGRAAGRKNSKGQGPELGTVMCVWGAERRPGGYGRVKEWGQVGERKLEVGG